jgi:hypothetical protein
LGFERSFDEKIDVIDLIINVLKDHEAKLDELVSRLEDTQISSLEMEEPPKTREPKEVRRAPTKAPGPVISVVLKRWSEFVERGESAELVAFDTENGVFEVSAYVGDTVYVYKEEIPRMEMLFRGGEKRARIEEIDISSPELLSMALKGTLDCGLELIKRNIESEMDDGKILHQIVYEVDPVVTKSWIKFQLGLDNADVVQGKIHR